MDQHSRPLSGVNEVISSRVTQLSYTWGPLSGKSQSLKRTVQKERGGFQGVSVDNSQLHVLTHCNEYGGCRIKLDIFPTVFADLLENFHFHDGPVLKCEHEVLDINTFFMKF